MVKSNHRIGLLSVMGQNSTTLYSKFNNQRIIVLPIVCKTDVFRAIHSKIICVSCTTSDIYKPKFSKLYQLSPSWAQEISRMSLYSNYFWSCTEIRKCTLFAHLTTLLFTVNDQNERVKYRCEIKDTNYNKIDSKVKSCLPSIWVSTY